LLYGRHEERGRILLGSGKPVIGEGDVRADEGVIGQSQSVPELHTTLDRHVVADDDIVFDEDVIADIAVLPDPRAGQNMGKRPYPRSFAYVTALADSMLVDEWSAHC
jgi:hypothetical protein